jgi:hypothetical protein
MRAAFRERGTPAAARRAARARDSMRPFSRAAVADLVVSRLRESSEEVSRDHDSHSISASCT